MTKRAWLSAIVAGTVLAIAMPHPFARADDGVTAATAVKKKHERHVAKHHVRRESAYPALEPYRSSGFIGQYPGSCAYDRAAGRCMIDLGYGRCVSCDIGSGRW
jgi:hypothetical protein